MSIATEQVTASHSRTDGYALISTDRRLVLAIAEVAHANGYPIKLRTAQPMAELYVHISRIWNAKGGTRPFTLRGKQGVWKQIDQQYLADGLMWCVKTVSRNLLKLERAGLIRYVRHGYITKKYVQLFSLEVAQSNAGVAQMYAPSADEAPADTQVSITYRTSSPLGNGHEVPCLQDMKSVSNTETDDLESIDIESNQELSAAQSAAHPVQRGKSLLIIETAVSQFDACQKQHDGIRTDGWTIESLMQQTVGMTDDEVAQACGVALHLSRAWAWSQGRPSACPAGETIGAVIKGTAWSPVPGVTCTPDVAETFTWDDANQTFVDSVGFDVFEREIQQPVFAAVEAPSALDKEGDSSPVSVTLSDAAVSPVEAPAVNSALDTSPCPVKAVPSPVQPFNPVPPSVPHETRKTSVGMNQRQVEDARNAALAAFKAAGFNASPSGRYGTPPASLNNTADCGEEYFASIQRSNTAVLERDNDDYPF